MEVASDIYPVLFTLCYLPSDIYPVTHKALG